MGDFKVTTPPAIFSGWKDIAGYMGMGIRTLQRYERDSGLPIRRPTSKLKGVVFAAKTDLDAWILAKPPAHSSGLRVSLSEDGRMTSNRIQVSQRTNRLKVDFLLVDSEIALTFSSIALEAVNSEKKRRTIQTARKAFDTITRLRENVDFPEADRDKLDSNLRRLKSELQSPGQTF